MQYSVNLLMSLVCAKLETGETASRAVYNYDKMYLETPIHLTFQHIKRN